MAVDAGPVTRRPRPEARGRAAGFDRQNQTNRQRSPKYECPTSRLHHSSTGKRNLLRGQSHLVVGASGSNKHVPRGGNSPGPAPSSWAARTELFLGPDCPEGGVAAHPSGPCSRFPRRKARAARFVNDPRWGTVPQTPARRHGPQGGCRSIRDALCGQASAAVSLHSIRSSVAASVE